MSLQPGKPTAMWIKICANTCLEDALQAAELGADAVGFVFAPSKRQVTPQQVADFALKLPPELDRVGVFAGVSPEDIAEIAEIARLTAVQLHDGFDLARTRRLEERLNRAVSIIEVVHWPLDVIGEEAQRHAADGLKEIAEHASDRRVLVDTRVGTASGGTGISFDWQAAKPVFPSQPDLRIILAGGLRPENVAEAIRTLHPWGVDVASGVEREPGRKDPAKVKSFIENARGAASNAGLSAQPEQVCFTAD